MGTGNLTGHMQKNAAGEWTGYLQDRFGWRWAVAGTLVTLDGRPALRLDAELGDTPEHAMMPDETPDRRRV